MKSKKSTHLHQSEGQSNDPTFNVRLLLDEAIQRIDDLNEAKFFRIDAKIIDEVSRNTERFESEAKRVDELLKLRAESALQLSIAETKRLDSVRSVDVAAVSVAAERAAQQAVVLANQVSASADTLRALVASTATTVAQQLAVISNQLSDRLSVLEKSNYEGIGKGRATDPQLLDLISEVKNLRESKSNLQGKGDGMYLGWGILIGLIGVVGILFGIMKTYSPPVSSSPPAIYLPATSRQENLR